jgi:hypothetical protein
MAIGLESMNKRAPCECEGHIRLEGGILEENY